MTLMTWPISSLDAPSFCTVALVPSASRTARWAMLVASAVLLAISRILAPISSAPLATVWMLRETCSLAADTTLAWALVSSALADI